MPERDEHGRLFRWIAPRAVVIAHVPADTGRLVLEGEIPVDYLSLPLMLELRWLNRPLIREAVRSRTFHIERTPDVPLACGGGAGDLPLTVIRPERAAAQW